MIILNVTNCPSGLKGDLSKWLSEINTGVYIGRLNARVRDELWDRVCTYVKNGQATMVYSTNNEQGYSYLVHNTTWKPIDYDGIVLMQRPIAESGEVEVESYLHYGFSNAAKYEKVKKIQNGNKKSDGYIVLDIETTGLDFDNDRIIEIAMLKIIDDQIVDTFQCLVNADIIIPKDIETMTGITTEMVRSQGIREDVVLKEVISFIDDYLVLGYNVQFDINFLQRLGRRMNEEVVIRKTKDVLNIAKRRIDDVANYKLATVAEFFSFETGNYHRALDDCMLTYKIFCELNKI